MKLTKLTSTLLGCFGIATLVTGCASVLCGPRQEVTIDSLPTGAKIQIYDSRGEVVFDDTTPCAAKLNRGGPGSMEAGQYTILIKRDGYSPVQVPLTGVVNRAYALNAFNVVGFVVDPMTGSMWTLRPDKLDAKLIGQSAGFFKNPDTLMICLKQDVPQDLQPSLEPAKN